MPRFILNQIIKRKNEHLHMENQEKNDQCGPLKNRNVLFETLLFQETQRLNNQIKNQENQMEQKQQPDIRQDKRIDIFFLEPDRFRDGVVFIGFEFGVIIHENLACKGMVPFGSHGEQNVEKLLETTRYVNGHEVEKHHHLETHPNMQQKLP